MKRKRPYPVYTVETECQDCYKCVRHCPVKAIQVRDGHAAVVPELCVGCGHCVEICPVKAKQVRDDTDEAKELLADRTHPVYASLAPSWVSEFSGVEAKKFIRALKKLGFAGVGETAVGAQLVTDRVARELEKNKPGILLSSACPAAVDFVRRYLPELSDKITPLGSPLMAHCRLLREHFGPEIRVIFLGPCIAKKNEADRNPELIDLALTYPELKRLFKEEEIDPARCEAGKEDVFVPFAAEEGALYPIEGGMNRTIEFQCANSGVRYAAFTGLDNIRNGLRGVARSAVSGPVFVELLACPGGCVHGPRTEHESPGLVERLRILDTVRMPEAPAPRTIKSSIAAKFPADPHPDPEPTPEKMAEALRSIGKTTPEDELNCGGCGYDSCRNCARALLSGRAEPSMCVSYLRKQAQKKANALLRSMNSGGVIADKNLCIVECNRNFARLFGNDTLEAYEACPGLSGADLRRIVPFADLFEGALKSGREVRRDSIKIGRSLFSVNIFSIDPGETVGAVIFDVTQTELRREQIAARARRVIDNNISAVQEIANRLGEQMADTELLLRSIADDYAAEDVSATFPGKPETPPPAKKKEDRKKP